MTSPRITRLPKPKKSNATSRKKRTPRGRAPAPLPQVPSVPGKIKGPIGKIRKLKPGKGGIGLSPVKRKKNNKKVRKVSNKGKMVLF